MNTLNALGDLLMFQSVTKITSMEDRNIIYQFDNDRDFVKLVSVITSTSLEGQLMLIYCATSNSIKSDYLIAPIFNWISMFNTLPQSIARL